MEERKLLEVLAATLCDTEISLAGQVSIQDNGIQRKQLDSQHKSCTSALAFRRSSRRADCHESPRIHGGKEML